MKRERYSDAAWNTFSSTGKVGVYLLYRALKGKKNDLEK